YKLLTGSVIPRPIAWVTTCMADGRTNLAPFSQFIIISSDPGLLGFSIGPDAGRRKDTLVNLERERETVINSAPEELAQLIQATSEPFPPDVSEVDHFGLTTVPSRHVRPPRLGAAAVQFECGLERLIPLGTSTLVVGRVLIMHIASGLLDLHWRIDHSR